MIILIAEYIASASGERARAPVKALIGAVPQNAIVKRNNQEITVAIKDLKIGDIVLVKAGKKIKIQRLWLLGRLSDGSFVQSLVYVCFCRSFLLCRLLGLQVTLYCRNSDCKINLSSK
jgi:hypothetical protein